MNKTTSCQKRDKSICRKREKKYVSIRAHILILVLLTTEVHSGEGSDNYPGWFKQKKRNGGQREPRAQEEAIGERFRYTRQRAKRAGQASQSKDHEDRLVLIGESLNTQRDT